MKKEYLRGSTVLTILIKVGDSPSKPIHSQIPKSTGILKEILLRMLNGSRILQNSVMMETFFQFRY